MLERLEEEVADLLELTEKYNLHLGRSFWMDWPDHGCHYGWYALEECSGSFVMVSNDVL